MKLADRDRFSLFWVKAFVWSLIAVLFFRLVGGLLHKYYCVAFICHMLSFFAIGVLVVSLAFMVQKRWLFVFFALLGFFMFVTVMEYAYDLALLALGRVPPRECVVKEVDSMGTGGTKHYFLCCRDGSCYLSYVPLYHLKPGLKVRVYSDGRDEILCIEEN